MIDTIHFSFLARKKSNIHWQKFYEYCRERRIRMSINTSGKVFVQCSLPKFAYGCNGILLKSQKEIDTALNDLKQWLERGLIIISEFEFSRIDLCWQFEADIQFMTSSLAGCKHPMIKGPPAVKLGESLWWGTRNSNKRITIYDKNREQNKQAGDVVRVEIVLRNKALRDTLNGGQPVETLNFDHAYRAYRNMLILFNPPPRALLEPGKGHTKRMIAAAELEGKNVLEDYLGKFKNKQSANRVRKQIRAIQLEMSAINFKTILPTKGPPRPVDVLLKKYGIKPAKVDSKLAPLPAIAGTSKTYVLK